MTENLPKNAVISHKDLGKGYASAITETDKKYDILFIDGRQRSECAKLALKSLNNTGVIIWDNTERERYQPQINNLINQGFKKLDFFGMTPIDNKLSVTSIFYRDNNVLRI